MKINKCIDRLQLYCEKVEIQTDKVAEVVDSSESELIAQLIAETDLVSDKAMNCVLDLKQFRDEINLTKAKATEEKEKLGLDQIVEIQKQMNYIVSNQMKQHHEFLEKQELKKKELASTVKLPKLDMIPFYGDKLQWTEFWNAFENAVHNNKKLSNIENFNYLKSKLNGEAKSAIQGLTLSKENYDVAIGILKDRFGNEQEVIDLHCSKMINLTPATNKTSSLRNLLDSMEKHLRSLEVLKQNIDQDVFVSMIRAKLPEEVLLQYEILHGTKNKWTIEALRHRLHDYITAREHAEKKDNAAESQIWKRNQSQTDRKPRGVPFEYSRNRDLKYRSDKNSVFVPLSKEKQMVKKSNQIHTSANSAEALVANQKQHSVTRFYDQCRYCNNRHWSDECTKYPTIEERKKQLTVVTDA